jgi:hypothetical protein
MKESQSFTVYLCLLSSQVSNSYTVANKQSSGIEIKDEMEQMDIIVC